MKRIAVACIAALALAGCSPTTSGNVNFAAQLQKSCATAKPVVEALTILDDGGQLSPKNSEGFARAKLAYQQVCDGTVTDFATAAVKAATIYVTIALIAKAEKRA